MWTSRGISGCSFPKVHIGTVANVGRYTEITVGQLLSTTFGACGRDDLANSASTKDCAAIQVLARRTEALSTPYYGRNPEAEFTRAEIKAS
jgi:hypothetical protein